MDVVLLVLALRASPGPEVGRSWGDFFSIVVSADATGLFAWRVVGLTRQGDMTNAQIVSAPADLMGALNLMMTVTSSRYFVRKLPRLAPPALGVRTLLSGLAPILEVVAFELE